MTTDPRIVYEFGPFRMDPDKQVLLRENQPIPVTPKAFETLLALVRRSHEVVTKEELLKEIWPDSFVEESNLSQNIFMLRKALGDTADNRQYIVTLPGKGYRFAAQVRTVTQGDLLIAHARTRTQILIEENEADPDALKTLSAAAPPSKKPHKALYFSVATAVLLSAALAVTLFLHRSPASPAGKEWQQLTFFTDSAVYPALSPDGRMLAFIRGSDSFMGTGQIYVKMLSGGEPVQLTNDTRTKLAPTFSPDGSNVAYSVTEPWDTWEVPVLGGEPHLLIPNSSSLTWIEQGKRLLFSEFREGIHLVVITTDEDRGNSRDAYVPAGKRSMAHHSYLSPDGRWLLIVEMDSQSKILPCRVVPFPAAGSPPTNRVKLVGPPHLTCIAAAWSPDGKWIYLTASDEPGGIGRAGWLSAAGSHVWRQRFPDGEPEQVTFGPTSQEGMAMSPDGQSFVTSVGTQDRTVWIHDKDGEHQISSEGNASSPTFSSDGRSLYFLMSNGQTHGEELWIKDLSTEKVERVLPGYPMQDYSVSPDGKQVAFTRSDQGSPSNIWVAPTSRRSPPVRISSAVAEDAPLLLPSGGDLVFRATEGGANFLYRMKIDGSARQKISSERILDSYSISPDGRWVVAETPGSGDQEHITLGTTKAFAVDGTATVPLCVGYCLMSWDTTGGFVYFRFPQVKEGSYALPATRGTGLPDIPPSALNIEDITTMKSITAITWEVESAVNPSIYAYTRVNTRRNLYRIQLP